MKYNVVSVLYILTNTGFRIEVVTRLIDTEEYRGCNLIDRY